VAKQNSLLGRAMAKNINVLLIQDDTEQISFISDMLAKVKDVVFYMEAAHSVLEAFECLDQKEIDVILFDQRLMDEEQAYILNPIRARSPGTAIVLMLEGEDSVTGYNPGDTGTQDYIHKSEMSPRLLELTLLYAIERKQSQATLRTAEGRLQVIIESIKDFAIFSTDTSGHIVFWNSGAEHIFEYAEAEVINQHFEILFTPGDRDAEIPAKELRDAAQKGMAVDERWHMKKGSYLFYASGMTRPTYDEMENLIGFTKVARDLTERQMANDQREDLLQRALEARHTAEQTNTLKEEFLAMIAHEMRTPLASIVGFASMMTSKTMTWPRESLVEYAAIIEDEAQRMSGLIEQLMDHTRQQTGTLKIDFELTSLGAIIRSAMPRLHALNTEHHLLIDIPSELPRIYVDPQRIAQVLTNLIGNAARYSRPQTQVTIHAQHQGEYVQVDVIDEGRGIPPEQREKVFEPFHQVDHASTKGLGLGLALCKNLVERHHGRIWVQDHSDPGTIISFTLPIQQDGAET